MMEGFVNKLIESTSKQVLWIIIPIVNIDGVVSGNNRTGIVGHDFNRNWSIDEDVNNQQFFPEIMGILKYFKQKKKTFSKKVKIYLDFHGHSS